MKCPECGQDVVGEDKFCNHCGATLPGAEAAAPKSDESPAAGDDAPQDPAPIADDTPSDLESSAEEPEVELEAKIAPAVVETQAPPTPGEPVDSGAPPVVKATKKPNTGLIIAIVVLVVLLLCCCCAIGIIAANYEQIIEALESVY